MHSAESREEVIEQKYQEHKLLIRSEEYYMVNRYLDVCRVYATGMGWLNRRSQAARLT